jgi:hypothetical protein
MMPRLSIGIPTMGARPERLEKAVGSALAQTVPARVLIVNQGNNPAAAAVAEKFKNHPLVRHFVSDADSLWRNWTFAAECADTELFAWLQDDDVLAPHAVHRMTQGLDAFPQAAVYLARLGVSLAAGLANWWQATGPMVPMDLLHGAPCLIHGNLVTAAGFFTSFALSPGVAFRVTPQSIEACRATPIGCDLYAERIILAELVKQGPAVCDPAIVGYWVQHEGNESRRLNGANVGKAQFTTLAAHLDRLLADREGWQSALAGWSLMLGPENLRHYLKQSAEIDGDFPRLAEARSILAGVLNDPPAEEARPARQAPVQTAVAPAHRNASKAVARNGR